MRASGGDGKEVKYMGENILRHAHFNSLNTYLFCTYSILGTILGTGDIALNKTENILVLVGLCSRIENFKYENKNK